MTEARPAVRAERRAFAEDLAGSSVSGRSAAPAALTGPGTANLAARA